MTGALTNFKDPDCVSTPDFLTKTAPSLPVKDRDIAISTLSSAILSLRRPSSERTGTTTHLEKEKLPTYENARKRLQEIALKKLQERAPVRSSSTKKIAAVVFGVLLTGAGAGVARGLKAPAPMPPSPTVPQPLQRHTWSYVGLLPDEISQIADRTVRYMPFTPAILSERAIYPASSYQNLSPVEQLADAAAFTVRAAQLTKETPVGILRAAYDEATLRGHALEKIADTLKGGRENVDDLAETARNLAKLICEDYKASSRVPSWNETTVVVEEGGERPAVQPPATKNKKPPEWNVKALFDPTQAPEGRVSTDQVGAAYGKKCKYLERARTFIERGEDALDPEFVRQTKEWIEVGQKQLDSWKAGLMTHIKEQLEKKQAELKTRHASLKLGDISKIERLLTDVQTHFARVEESAGHLSKKTSASLKSEAKKLEQTLYTNISTTYASQYRTASLNHLLQQVQGLVDGKPLEENLYLDRQENALASLPADAPQKTYYETFLSLQRDFDTLISNPSLKKKALSQKGYQDLAAGLDSLHERAVDLSKIKGVTKDEARATKDVFDDVVAKARLAMAKTAVEQLQSGTMSYADGNLLRKWVLKFLDTLKATGQLGKEGGKAVSELKKRVPAGSLFTGWFTSGF